MNSMRSLEALKEEVNQFNSQHEKNAHQASF
jgi:hypothetical protein